MFPQLGECLTSVVGVKRVVRDYSAFHSTRACQGDDRHCASVRVYVVKKGTERNACDSSHRVMGYKKIAIYFHIEIRT